MTSRLDSKFSYESFESHSIENVTLTVRYSEGFLSRRYITSTGQYIEGLYIDVRYTDGTLYLWYATSTVGTTHGFGSHNFLSFCPIHPFSIGRESFSKNKIIHDKILLFFHD